MKTSKTILLVLYILAALVVCKAKDSGTPPKDKGPNPYCWDIINDLLTCEPYLEIPKPDDKHPPPVIDKPGPKCCSGLADVMRMQPLCLCFTIKTAVEFNVNLNWTRVGTLGDVCKQPDARKAVAPCLHYSALPPPPSPVIKPSPLPPSSPQKQSQPPPLPAAKAPAPSMAHVASASALVVLVSSFVASFLM